MMLVYIKLEILCINALVIITHNMADTLYCENYYKKNKMPCDGPSRVLKQNYADHESNVVITFGTFDLLHVGHINIVF